MARKKEQAPPPTAEGLLKLIRRFPPTHAQRDVLDTFLALSFYSVAQRVPGVSREEREGMEAKYLSTIHPWRDREERHLFPEMFATLATALATRYEDVLGPVAAEASALNSGAGQFFTPWEVCRLMAGMQLGDSLPEGKPYLTMQEPAVGSGAMVLAMADQAAARGWNPTVTLLVEATDVDLRCVRMAYLQFALAGIPAKVVHGNALSGERWGEWYTPAIGPFLHEHRAYHAVRNVRKRRRLPLLKEAAE